MTTSVDKAPDRKTGSALRGQRAERSTSGKSRGSAARRRVNLPLLAATIVVIATLTPALYFAHGYQVRRTADSLLDHADRAEKREEWLEASGYLERYLALRPDDAAARLRLAESFDRAVESGPQAQRSIALLYRAVGLAEKSDQLRPRLPDLRLLLTSRLIDVGRFAEAERQAGLLAAQEADPSATRLLALALWGRRQQGTLGERDPDAVDREQDYYAWLSNQPVGEVFETALALNPDDVGLASRLAGIYRSQPDLFSAERRGELEKGGRLARARTIIDEMKSANPENPEALLERYAFYREDDPAEAEADLQLALEVTDRRDSLVLLVAAEYYRHAAADARAEGDEPKAESTLRKARLLYEELLTDVDPQSEPGYLGWGEAWLGSGDVDEAIDTWRRGIDRLKTPSLTLQARLAAAQNAAGRHDEAEETLAGLDAIVRKKSPALSRDERRRWENVTSLEWVLVHIGQGDFHLAVPLLEDLATGIEATDSIRLVRVLRLLGDAYAGLAQWDSAANAYERAFRLYPSDPELQAATGVAWTAAGRPDLGVAHLRFVQDESAEHRLSFASALYELQLIAPPEERQWEEFLAVLETLKQITADAPQKATPLRQPWRVRLLEAEFLYAAGGSEGRIQAAGLLGELRRRFATDPELLRRLVFGYERLGDASAADATLAQFNAVAMNQRDPWLVEAGLLSLRGRHEEARRLLATAGKEHPEYLQEFQMAAAQVSIDEGKLSQAERELAAQAGANVNLLKLRQLAEVALNTPYANPGEDGGRARRQWAQRLETWERRLLDIEGPEGTFWRYYRCQRLLALSDSADPAGLKEAQQLQVEIEQRRPSWPASQLLQGMIAEKRGYLDDAIDAYESVLRLGDRRLSIYKRLISLLYRRGRSAEAEGHFARLADQIQQSRDLSALAMSVLVDLDRVDRALSLAKQGALTRDDDPMAWIWYGQMSLMSAEGAADPEAAARFQEDAERQFRHAVEISGKQDVAAWGGLLGFYLRTQQLEQARSALAELQQDAQVDEVQREFVAAQGLEMLGDREGALAHYQRALELNPGSAPIRLRLAAFYVQDGRIDDARRELEAVLARDPGSGAARRLLMAILAAQGGDEAWRRIAGLLDSGDVEITRLDRRLQAILLSQRGRETDLEEARKLLERLLESPTATDGEKLLLAQIYARQGNALVGVDDAAARVKRRDAQRLYEEIVRGERPAPVYLSEYARFLMKHSAFHPEFRDLADRQLRRLQQVDPGELRYATLRADWHAAGGELDEARQTIADWVNAERKRIADDPTAAATEREAYVMLTAGNLYSSHGLHGAAEMEFAELRRLKPEAFGPYAVALARQGDPAKRQEAIQICLKHADDDDTAHAATVLASILVLGRPTEAELRQAAPLLAAALRAFPNDAKLLLAVANLRVIQGRGVEAESLFAKVVQVEPDNYIAHNNLATLLAERSGQGDEALRHIDRAIEIAGQSAELLDTKGLILIQRGEFAQAALLFRRAAAIVRDEPRYPFHLVLSLLKLNELSEARRAWAALDADALERQTLTPADRLALAEMKKTLGPPAHEEALR